jgi:hypothetical protein
MSERERRPNEILGARVTLTGWDDKRRKAAAAAVAAIVPGAELPDADALPMVLLSATSREKAEAAGARLRAAGAAAEITDTWVTREQAPDTRARPTCPHCGSARTQPFTHSGPAGRFNMKCLDCAQLFKTASR